MIDFLIVASVALTSAIVLVLSFYLIQIFLCLKRGADSLEALAGGLIAIRDNTGPLDSSLSEANRQLSELLEPLATTNLNLLAVINFATQKLESKQV